VHAGLVRRLESTPDDGAIEQAMRQLQAGGDLALLLATAKAMVRVGVAGLAARLIRSAGEQVSGRDEIREVLAQLDALPSGEVRWAEREAAAASNLESLLASRPNLAPIADELAASPVGLRLFRTAQGNDHVVRDHPDGGLDLLFAFQDHQAHAAATSLSDIQLGTTFLLLGVPSSSMWNRLVETRHANGYRPAIDLVETSLPVLAVWLRLVDAATALGDERITVCAGSDAVNQYESFLRLNHGRQLPSVVLRLPRTGEALPDVAADFLPAIEAARSEQRAALLVRQASFYEHRDASWWRRRFESAGADDQRLCFAGFVTRYSTYIRHAMRDLAAAFARRGCRLDVVMEPHDAASVVDTWTTLAAKPYDGIVVINHMRAESADAVHPDLPFITWIQDHMDTLLTPEAGRSVGPRDIVVARDTGNLSALYGYPSERLIESSSLTDPVTYSCEPVAEADRDAVRADVCSIGHGWEPPALLVTNLCERTSGPVETFLRSYLDLVIERLDARPWINFRQRLELVDQAALASGLSDLSPVQRGRQLFPLAEHVFDRAFRHQVLDWCAAWAETRGRTLRIYGHGWDAHPRLAGYAAGPVENGYPLRCVLQATAVVVQANGYDSLHPRLLDCAAAGGCALVRYNGGDFQGPAYADVASHVDRLGVRSLAELAERAKKDAALGDAVRAAEKACGLQLASSTDDRRRRDIALLERYELLPAALLDDEGFFEAIRSRSFMAGASAVDLEGFSRLCFDSAESLSSRLDLLVDDAAARQDLMAPVRRAVLAQCTTDGLVARILDRLQSLVTAEQGPAGGSVATVGGRA
jgi:hypothetical protein